MQLDTLKGNGPTARSVRARACQAAFGGQLITNNLRGLVAEAIVAGALEPEWRWCAADWAGWDFERRDGFKLEVKQSAARQTWSSAEAKATACRFDIRARSGWFVGADWYPSDGRPADLFVFAHHFVCDASADHCAPEQWRFFVVAECSLPSAKTIGLRAIERLGRPCDLDELALAVSACAETLKPKHV